MAKENQSLLPHTPIPWKKVLAYVSLASIPLSILQGIFTFAGVRKNQSNGFQEGFLNIGTPPPNPGDPDHPALSITATETAINLLTSALIMWMVSYALKTGRTVLFFILGMMFAFFNFAFTSGMYPYMTVDARKSARYEGYLIGNTSGATYSNPYSFWDSYPSSLIAQTSILDATVLVSCIAALYAGYKIAHLMIINPRTIVLNDSDAPPHP